LEKEGHKAISLQDENPQLYLDDDEVIMAIGEEKTVTQPQSLNEPEVKKLIQVSKLRNFKERENRMGREKRGGVNAFACH
jgi:hypothetical protein